MNALIATRKGLMILKDKGSKWALAKTHFEGVKVSYAWYDAKTKWIWVGLNHGHWGPKVHVSKDGGESFTELAAPVFPEWTKDNLKDFWGMARDSKGRLYLGVEPAGLFYSDNHGKTWEFIEGLARIHGKDKWFSGGTDGSCVHSIIIDPQNPNHLIIGISVAGVIESKDRGITWTYANKGLKATFLPDPDSEFGQDPHAVAAAPSDSNILWQQNHCGIFKSEDKGRTWIDLSNAKGLKSSFGWAVVVDEKNPKVAFTVPALSDEIRIPVGKRLYVQKTEDGGKSWKALNKGLPKGECYDIVYRHALSLRQKKLMFGSTTGNVYFSNNQGKNWKQVDVHFPPVYSVWLY